MVENNEWQMFRWYCVNCGHMVHGVKNKEGRIKVQCGFCRSVLVRTPKSRRADYFYVTAPRDMAHV